MKENYGSHHFFKSYTFEKMGFTVVNMGNVQRTKNKHFLAALDVMRYDEKHRITKLCSWMNKLMYKPTIPKGLPVMSSLNEVADKANARALSIIEEPLFTYNAVVTGDYNIKNCPVGSKVELKVGALVVMVVNDLENGEYNNGSIGKVTMLLSDSAYILFEHSGEEVLIQTHLFEQSESKLKSELTLECGTVKQQFEDEIVGSCSVLPCRLAFGMSVHRNQGATIKSPCVVDIGREGFSWGTFGQALLYVACSRFENPEHIYLRYPVTPKHFKANQEILEWVKGYELTKEIQ